jgi:hypothetical protein
MDHLNAVRGRIKEIAGVDCQLLSRLGGPAGQVALTAEYETMSAWEAANDRTRADPEWSRMVSEAGRSRLFIPGTTETVLWRVE